MRPTLPALHAEFIDRVRSAVEHDRRLGALLAGGSYIHGGFDEQSDLDFVVLVDEPHYEAVMADRRAFAGQLGPLLAAFTGEHVGEPRLLICLYGPPLLHVDLKFATLSDLDRRVERPAVLFARDPDAINARLDAAAIAWPDASPDWFEQRAWIWLHYGAAKLRRGELLEAIGMLAWFRDQVLGPMLHRRGGRPQRGVRRIEAQDREAARWLAATHPPCEPAAVRGSYLAAIELYVQLRADDPPRVPTPHMPQALQDFLG